MEIRKRGVPLRCLYLYTIKLIIREVNGLENQKPKIVPTPQTELDKALKIKIVGSKKQRNKERNKALNAAKSKKKNERMREREQRNKVDSLDSPKKKTHWTCSQCGMNPAWLNYSICYQCYVKNGNRL